MIGRHVSILFRVSFAALILLLIAVLAIPAQAQEPDIIGSDDSACLVCHTPDTDQQMIFADDSQFSIAVDHAALLASAHGQSLADGPFGCSDCHGENSFPHEGPPAASVRAYRITQSNVCIDCHEDQAENLSDGVHYTALLTGNLRSATCVDCHGAHDVQGPERTSVDSAEACGTCHQIVYNEFSQSVHGEALLAGDSNVPTCTDCHGVHGIQHPTTALFRNRSPELCADCHADEPLMAQYDITTNVFNSYLSDFHGTTVALFEQEAPDVASNKAVCYDCHGVHNIAASDDNKSQVVRENLLATCQQCHPDATSDFPDSWVGHFPPTLDSHPLLFLVDVFYTVLIPLVLGAFIFLVATDIFRRVRHRLSGTQNEA